MQIYCIYISIYLPKILTELYSLLAAVTGFAPVDVGRFEIFYFSDFEIFWFLWLIERLRKSLFLDKLRKAGHERNTRHAGPPRSSLEFDSVSIGGHGKTYFYGKFKWYLKESFDFEKLILFCIFYCLAI